MTATNWPPPQPAWMGPVHGRKFGYTFDGIGNRSDKKFARVAHAYVTNVLKQYTQRATPSWIAVAGRADYPGDAQVEVSGAPLPGTAWVHRYFYHAEAETPASNAHLQGIAITGIVGALGNGKQTNATRHTFARPKTEVFAYDFDSNLTANSLWHYTYDGENRLKWMRCLLPDESRHKVSIEFIHDYTGRRVTKDIYYYTGDPALPAGRASVSRTVFLYHGWTLLTEYSAPSTSPFKSGPEPKIHMAA